MIINIYYIWAIINLFWFIKRILNFKSFLKSIKTSNNFYKKESNKYLILKISFIFWLFLGLLGANSLYFLIWIIYFFIMNKIKQKNNDFAIIELNNYNLIKIYFEYGTHILLLLFSILNFYFFGIDLNVFIKNII